MPLHTLIDHFIAWLRIERNASPKTVEQYELHLWTFLRYIMECTGEEDGLWEDFDHRLVYLDTPADIETRRERERLREYLDRYDPSTATNITAKICTAFRLDIYGQGKSVKTCNAYMVTLRTFLKYARKHGTETLDPTIIDLARIPMRHVSYLTDEEMTRLFAIIDTGTLAGLRDRAIISCIYSTGLRISELTSLDRSRVDLDRGEFSIRGKGQKVRVVYLTSQATEDIRTYLNARSDTFLALFIRHNYSKENTLSLSDADVRLSRFFITGMIKEYALRANIIKNVSAHTLRHSFATTLLGHGADIRSIQELLGHASITTTQVYTHVTNPKLKEVHQRFHSPKEGRGGD